MRCPFPPNKFCAHDLWLVARASCPCLNGLEARSTVVLQGIRVSAQDLSRYPETSRSGPSRRRLKSRAWWASERLATPRPATAG